MLALFLEMLVDETPEAMQQRAAALARDNAADLFKQRVNLSFAMALIIAPVTLVTIAIACNKTKEKDVKIISRLC